MYVEAYIGRSSTMDSILEGIYHLQHKCDSVDVLSECETANVLRGR